MQTIKPLKIIFAGTPDFAAKHLQALIDSQHEIIGVYTMPDKPAGRGKKIQASPVKQLAEQNNLPVYQPESFKDPVSLQELQALNPDILVVVAYGMLLPKAVLDIPKYGCLNVHGSLLPRWRGAAPIQRSIWAGDKTTGVTIMQMDEGLDTGDMLYKAECEITAQDTSASLYDKLAIIGPPALIKVLNDLDKFPPKKQHTDQISYAKKLLKTEAKLNWKLSAVELERYIRAFIPFPIAFLEITDGQGNVTPIKILQAEVIEEDKTNKDKPGTIIEVSKLGIKIATKKGILNLLSLQPPGKKPLPVQDFLNGRKDWFKQGDILV